jgi:predicted glycosyltransferase
VHSLLISGPEMRAGQRQRLAEAAARQPRVIVREFTDDFMSYLNAADVVISMGGYNTVCEILSGCKRALVVPRVSPVQEQWLRAERMARLQLFKTLHPDRLTAEALSRELLDLLNADEAPAAQPPLSLDAQTKIAECVSALLAEPGRVDWAAPGARPAATRTGSS